MNVASLELCRDLFELSGWGQSETHLTYYDGSLDETEPWDRGADNRKSIPAYDLGYLLRRLPPLGHKDNDPTADSWLTLELAGDIWFCGHKGWGNNQQADIPEDAVCKFAIELFKQGILKRQ